jgi:hypothetical protein
VPLTTVQAWLGHSSISITARYLHHLGDVADRAALQLLNDGVTSALSQRVRRLSSADSVGRDASGPSGPDLGLGR